MVWYRDSFRFKRRPDGSLSQEIFGFEPTRCQTQYQDETDIHTIMKKHVAMGTVPNAMQGVYADFSDVGDYHSMMNKVLAANEAFESLPVEAKLRFKNDPGQIIDFLKDEKNRDEAIKLGLISKPADPSELSKATSAMSDLTKVVSESVKRRKQSDDV